MKKHIVTISKESMLREKDAHKDCRGCQTSCQSACKTSCTVGNQTCKVK